LNYKSISQEENTSGLITGSKNTTGIYTTRILRLFADIFDIPESLNLFKNKIEDFDETPHFQDEQVSLIQKQYFLPFKLSLAGMGKIYDKLKEDFRVIEGLKSCINCGTCSAICPAASFYNYDPREIAVIVQRKDDDEIISLLKSDTIWYCGECMSCKTRCPRGNTPGLIICALRALSQELGYFTESEKGRQQLAIKRTVGEWILNHGYCLYLKGMGTDLHPEQGPVWDWIQKNWNEIFERIGANYNGEGPGILRKIPEESLDEIRKIFEITGGAERFRKIESRSAQKAGEMKKEFREGIDNDYFRYVYSTNNNNHYRS
jgi:heterodisulfide reductase subunit C